MATSPLLAAMMGGNGSAMVMDPATMQAMPDLQLGQSMQQQGLSTAPASPWEAVARMAQAGVGSYLQHSATSDLAKAYAGSADALQQIFPQGTKLGDALRSSNPMVRMLAMQQAPKAMLLGSEPYSLGPDQERREGGNVIATSNQPQSPQGKVIRDAAAMEGAGVPEAGKALTRTIAKEGMIGDTGVSAPPIPLSRPPIPTAGISPPQQQPSPPQMDAARAALAQRMTAGNNAGLTGAHDAGATSLSDELAAARAKIAGAEERARAPYQSAGMTTVNGTERPVSRMEMFDAANKPATNAQQAIPTSSQQNSTVPPERAFPGLGKNPQYDATVQGNKDAMKEFVEKSTPSYDSANALMGRMQVIDHNIDTLGPNWMGAGANIKAETGKAWNSLLDTFNVKSNHVDPQKIASWEDFNKETIRAGMELIKSNFGGSREAASIIQMGNSAVPSVQNTYLGAKYVSATIKAAAQREIDLHEYKAGLAQSGQPIVGAEVAFNKTHPAQDYAMGAIASQIPPPAVQYLKSNPEAKAQFDHKFGPGTAEYVLNH